MSSVDIAGEFANGLQMELNVVQSSINIPVSDITMERIALDTAVRNPCNNVMNLE